MEQDLLLNFDISRVVVIVIAANFTHLLTNKQRSEISGNKGDDMQKMLKFSNKSFSKLAQ